MIQCNHCHKQYIGETKRRLKDRFNEHRRLVDKLTALSPLGYQNIVGVTIITLLTCNLFLLNSFNLIVTVYEKQEKHTSLKGVKPLNLMVFIRQIKLSTVLSMFKSFVLFIAAHYYFSGCNVFPYF